MLKGSGAHQNGRHRNEVADGLVLVPRGVWNVPYVYRIYLVKASVLRSELTDFELFTSDALDPDMAFCHNVREKVSR